MFRDLHVVQIDPSLKRAPHPVAVASTPKIAVELIEIAPIKETDRNTAPKNHFPTMQTKRNVADGPTVVRARQNRAP